MCFYFHILLKHECRLPVWLYAISASCFINKLIKTYIIRLNYRYSGQFSDIISTNQLTHYCTNKL